MGNIYWAIIAGDDFAGACKAGASGRVHSVFDKAMNIELDLKEGAHALLTLLSCTADEAPAALVTSMGSGGSWLDVGAKADSPVRLTVDAVFLEGRVLVSGVADARVWRGADARTLGELPHPAHGEMKRCCEAVASYIGTASQGQGVYPLVLKAPAIFEREDIYDAECPFLEQFSKGIGALRSALNANAPKLMADAVNLLLGLGFGLTPSGDDFLAGVLFSLAFGRKVYGRGHAAETALADAVSKHMNGKTNRISRHFLSCAVLGQWGCATEELMTAMFLFKKQPDSTLRYAVSKKLRYGATSGMDEIFGIMFGFFEMTRFFENMACAGKISCFESQEQTYDNFY